MDLREEYDRLLRYCYVKTRDRALAEDITQETFLRFWNARAYEDTGREMAYLYTIARNLCISAFRRPRTVPIDPEAASSDTGSMEDALVDRIVIREAMAGLPEDLREIVLLRYVNDVPVTTIGKIMGISRFAVHRKLRTAIGLLRRRVERGDGDDG
ncbi:MAG: sigma-70 family RNA polymerase sigma factor [Clostridia bacterium]|nr:sigma-70 family RNA polymerase sigma factor [Clostridia bacterium]